MLVPFFWSFTQKSTYWTRGDITSYYEGFIIFAIKTEPDFIRLSFCIYVLFQNQVCKFHNRFVYFAKIHCGNIIFFQIVMQRFFIFQGKACFCLLYTSHVANWKQKTYFNLLAADIDKDGEVSDADCIHLARHIAGWQLPYFD